MKKLLLSCGVLAALLIGSTLALAGTKWELVKDIALAEKPIDMALSADGTTAYVLSKNAITVYSLQDNRIVDTIPLEDKFISISMAPRGNMLLLASASDKKISVISISEVFDIPADTSPVIGSKDARVTLSAFLDFQCPYCSREFPVIEQLLEKYPNDLRLVIKHFPLRMHQFASQAAIASLAADRQGKYLELTRELFNNYKTLNEATLKEYAGKTGLDLEKFEQDQKDSAFQQQLQSDRQLAQKVGVKGVPGLYINGRAVQNRSLEGMAAMVDEELKKK